MDEAPRGRRGRMSRQAQAKERVVESSSFARRVRGTATTEVLQRLRPFFLTTNAKSLQVGKCPAIDCRL